MAVSIIITLCDEDTNESTLTDVLAESLLLFEVGDDDFTIKILKKLYEKMEQSEIFLSMVKEKFDELRWDSISEALCDNNNESFIEAINDIDECFYPTEFQLNINYSEEGSDTE